MCGERGRERERSKKKGAEGVREGNLEDREDQAAEKGECVNDAALLRNVSVYATGVQHGGGDGLRSRIGCTLWLILMYASCSSGNTQSMGRL